MKFEDKDIVEMVNYIKSMIGLLRVVAIFFIGFGLYNILYVKILFTDNYYPLSYNLLSLNFVWIPILQGLLLFHISISVRDKVKEKLSILNKITLSVAVFIILHGCLIANGLLMESYGMLMFLYSH